MATSINSDGEWTVVKTTSKNGTRRVKASKQGNLSKFDNKINAEKATALSNAILTNSDIGEINSKERIDQMIELINKTFQELKTSAYYKTILEKALTGKVILTTGITALGIGSIARCYSTSYSSSLWQFSLLLVLKDLLTSMVCSPNTDFTIPVVCYEPQFCVVDDELCRHYGIAVMKDNSRGFFDPIQSSSSPSPDIINMHFYYMPHCPYRLYCNVLWSHWEELNNIAIIGNSFSSYEVRRMSITPREYKAVRSSDRKRVDFNPFTPSIKEDDLVALVTPFIQEVPLWNLSWMNKSVIAKDTRQSMEAAFCEMSLLTFPSGTSSIFENPKPVKHIMISATDEDCEVF